MNAVDRLRRDHQILRAKLDVLESALHMGPETWFVLREVCFTLGRQLGDHIKREEDLVMACRKTMNPRVLAEVSVEHHDEPEHLRTINQMFIEEREHSLERVKVALQGVIDGLRRHMAEEEAELFPILERELATRAPAPPAIAPEKMLDERMTVNRIVQEFPRTRPVFERLFINVPYEGCTCVDEVAWRHGMEAQDLLKMLEQTVASCECAQSHASAERE